MDNKKFIITTNDESASLLIQTGFHLVSQNGKQWTFLNDNKMLFNNLSDVVYLEKLFFIQNSIKSSIVKNFFKIFLLSLSNSPQIEEE